MEIAALCQALAEAGIDLTLTEAQSVCLRPAYRAHQHPQLVAQVREHKAAVSAHLEQEVLTQRLVAAFIADRCVHREGAALTWMAFRGAFQSWVLACEECMPALEYVQAYLDAHYARLTGETPYPRWSGLTFTVKEWLGDDEGETSTPTSAPAAVPRKPRLVLKA